MQFSQFREPQIVLYIDLTLPLPLSIFDAEKFTSFPFSIPLAGVLVVVFCGVPLVVRTVVSQRMVRGEPWFYLAFFLACASA